MNCSNCGERVQQNDSFCSQCGEPVSETDQSEDVQERESAPGTDEPEHEHEDVISIPIADLISGCTLVGLTIIVVPPLLFVVGFGWPFVIILCVFVLLIASVLWLETLREVDDK